MAAEPTILTVTNAEKLALTGIEVGQVVHITDAVQVSGGTLDGVYSIRGTNNGRVILGLLGVSNNDVVIDNLSAVQWDTINWNIIDAGGGVVYYSLSDVATPDLATDWKNASDDTPASITVVTPAVQQYTGTDPSDEANWEVVP